MRYELTEMEKKLSDIIWDKEPLSSGVLVKLCAESFDWKKSTTYTMLKKLELKGLFINSGGEIKSIITKDELKSAIAKDIVEESYEGSLTSFIDYYTKGMKLNDAQLDNLQRFIDSNRESRGWSRTYIRL